MRITFIISFIFHAVLIFGLQQVIDINWFAEPLPVFHVELLRPPVDALDDKSLAGADLERKKNKKDEEKSEDTISLDTKDKRYISYAKVIKERLQQNWQYPVKAKEDLIEGQVLVIFSLDRDGNLIGIRIMQPSQFDILNEETERVVKISAPFPSFPGSVTVKRLNIKANFTYRLKSS
jgi:TonB family protein